MATFSPSFLDQIRRRLSLADVIGRYATVQKRGSNLLACCPFHKEKSPSFYIYEEDGHYHCYGCKAHGDVFTFLMEKKGYTFPEVVEELAGQAGLQMPRDGESDEKDRLVREKRELYHEIMEHAAQFYEKKLLSNKGTQAKKYIDNRGITQETQKIFRLGYAPRGNVLLDHLQSQGYKTSDLKTLGLIKASRHTDSRAQETQDSKAVDKGGAFYDNFRDRLIFPIWDNRGRVIAFGGRILGAGEPKYLNSPETPLYHKSHIVYGYHLARQHKAKEAPVICSEGYMDVIALHQGGFKGAVAPLGTAITESQLRLLWRLDKEPIICLDGDSAGEKAAFRALEIALPVLQAGHSLRFVSLPSGEDPDTLIQAGKGEMLQNLYDTASPLVEKLWHTTLAETPIDTPEQKADLRKKLFGFLGQIRDGSVRKSYEFDINDRMRAHLRQLSAAKYNKGRQHESTRGNFQGAFARKISSQATAMYSINVGDTQTRILFACLLNHPEILPDVEHEFMEINLEQPDFVALREEVIHYLFEGLELDKQSLNNHLYSKGLSDTVESICNASTYTHARFAQPTENKDAVLESWRRIWNFYQGKSALEQDLKTVRDQLEANPTAENFSKLKRLQEEMALLKQ